METHSIAPPGHWKLTLRCVLLPVVLHVLLCLGLFQYGLTRAEMDRLHVEGPTHLIEPYLQAMRLYGPLGVIRTYLRGEQDERLYLEYARLLLNGRTDMAYVADRQNDASMNTELPPRAWPYRDVRLEYPPLAFLAVLPPAMFSLDYPGYRKAFIAFMLLLHFCNLWLVMKLLQPPAASWPERARFLERCLYASLLFMFCLGTVVVTRLDHLVLSATLLCLLAYQRAETSRGRARLAWAAACGALGAAGVMVKLVPGFAVLIAGVLWLRSGASDRYRVILAAGATGFICLAASNLGMYAWAGDMYLDTFRYHSLRGVQIESVYSGVIQLLRPWGLAMHVDESFGSTNLASSATEFVKRISPILFVASAGYVLWRRRFQANGEGALVATCALFLLFMLTNRVFSPQYLIWIGAPMCLFAARDRANLQLFLLCLATVWLSGLIFPRGYPLFKALHPVAVFILDLRNGMLIAFTVLFLRAYSRAKEA